MFARVNSKHLTDLALQTVATLDDEDEVSIQNTTRLYARLIYDTSFRDGEEELDRTTASLIWSGKS